MITGVFEGGGIKGLALAGAASAAIDNGNEFHRAIGTSAGAMVASLVIVGYRGEELRDTVCSIDWPSLLDAGPIASIPGIGKHLAMVFRKGLYRGDRLESVWADLLAQKGVRTFGDLPRDALTIVATDLEHARGLTLPDDLPRYGHEPSEFSVATAVRMSATVPFLFQPVPMLDATTGEQILVVDGAMTSKFPVQLATRGPDVVGFRLTSPEGNHTHTTVKGPVSLARAVMGSGISARESLPVLCGRLQNIVEIPVAHDSLDFDITPEDAGALYQIGYDVASRQFAAKAG